MEWFPIPGGFIANWKKPVPPSELPDGVIWNVPTTSRWTLAEAREVMKTIGTRYIWWDWMCVPQVRNDDLGKGLLDAKGEEIGKQLHIYRNSKKSIVWLHSTSWAEESALKKILLLGMTRPGDADPEIVRKHTADVEQWIQTAQKEERWLKSGWTLQEGVLLGDTLLIDSNGKPFSDERFYNEAQATVRDLSIPISVLAHNLASAYFIHVEGHDPDPVRPGAGQFGNLLPKSPNSALWLRRSIKFLVETGLSREYKYVEDSCWALIGAMELENVKVEYGIPMDDVKRQFLSALIAKNQWEMFFLPPPSVFRWLSIADGALLPLGLFLVESHPSPGFTEDNLPQIIFSDEHFGSDDLRLKAKEGQVIGLFRAAKETVTWFRHYRQDEDGLRIVSPRVVAFAEDALFESAWFLPLWDVDIKGEIRGKRCVLLLRFNGESAAQPARAAFGGMIDIWGIGTERIEIDEIILDPTP
ncbi:hypothetical protein N7468_003421 [Penicillium chermesinum]|uniref:Heterokaryon incompatibility domain-containing protein n=1 Tax=Penicillium chermesinum TaxID=63820 RepID=A0A9W9P6M1_9EURO|nr:uncharacterized protein N7468_003421 [Penicillium chermesinum]KAJ5238802.1 hypothetical protein N7468_003421 [Penicillium chermesinum]